MYIHPSFYLIPSSVAFIGSLLSRVLLLVVFVLHTALGHSSQQSANQFLTLLQLLLEHHVLLEDVVLLLHHVLQQALHGVDQLVHLGQLLVQLVRLVLGFLDLALQLAYLATDVLQLTLLLESLNRHAPLEHGLPEALVLDEPVDDLPAPQLVDLLDVGLDLDLELLDLPLVLLGQLLHIVIEHPVLRLFLLSQRLVLGEQLDLALEDGFVVAGQLVQGLVVLGVLLGDLPVHLSQVLLRLVHELGDLGLQVPRCLVFLEQSNPFPEGFVFVPELFDSAHIQILSKQMILIIIMIKILSVCLLLAVLGQLQASQFEQFETNGTESYFVSPHGLGKTPEVDWSLDKLRSKLSVKDINYTTAGQVVYKITNVTMDVLYNDARQETSIPKNDYVEVAGGRIEFTYNFNWSKVGGGSSTNGYAYGSVLSDNLTYHKELAFCEGFICWRVPPSETRHDLAISSPMTIKRINPLLNETDKHHLEEMLFNATTSIYPSTLRQQVLHEFNDAFPAALNDSLNHQVFGQNIDYSFHSESHGQMKMTIKRKPFDFGVTPSTGYRVVFVTEILNYDEPICDITVPQKPDSFELHGGSQNFHLNCIYESVVEFMHGNKWLDTVLNYKWETDVFQFYAGDLFDLVNNLYLTFSPRAILEGECKAEKDGLRISMDRSFDVNIYALEVKYKCRLQGNNKEGSVLQVLKFNTAVKMYIKAEAQQMHLDFTIVGTDIISLEFEAAGPYVVNNIQLARFKAEKVMSQLKKTKTFGSGFPTIVRDIPKTLVTDKYVLYYDPSHIESNVDLLSI